MNKTKWQKLAYALKAIEEFNPKVRMKYVLDTDPCPGFAHLDWEWVKHGETSCIEWMEMDPVQKTFRGQLVAPSEQDFKEKIESALKTCHVPFSREGSLLKVWGYVRPGYQPNFV